MFYYDIELLYKRYEAYINEENEQNEIQQKKYEEEYQNMSNPNDMIKSTYNNLPQIPSYGGFDSGTLSKGFTGF